MSEFVSTEGIIGALSDSATSSSKAGAVSAVVPMVEQEKERRKGSGRHPANCQCAIHGGRKGKTLSPKSSGTASPESVVAAPVALVDPKVIAKSLAGIFGVVDKFTQRRVRLLAFKIASRIPEANAVTEADLQAAAVACTPEEIELIAELGTAVFQKYNIAGQYAPEILLIGALAAYGYRVHDSVSRLEKLAKGNPPQPASTTVESKPSE